MRRRVVMEKKNAVQTKFKLLAQAWLQKFIANAWAAKEEGKHGGEGRSEKT